VASAEHSIGKRIGDQALVVVGKHQAIEFLKRRYQLAKDFFFQRRCDRLAPLVINANNLLMTRNDSGLDGGYTRFARDDSGIGNSGSAQACTQSATWFIFSDNAKGRDVRAQRSQIC